MTPIIEVQNLKHVYSPGTPFETVAIHDINFNVYEGEFLAIVGHTGSGKSTFIQHLNGLLRPTEGKILFRGEDIFASKQKTREVRFKVGLVFQYPEYQLFEETVAADIAFGPKNQHLSEDEVTRRVQRAAELVGIPEDLMECSPFEISGGQKRRVAIAGVMAMEPDVLVLDEPTAGLDPESSEALMALLNRYRKQRGGTVIMVTHSMEDAAGYAQRIAVFENGNITMQGTPDEIFSQPEKLEDIGLALPEITQIAMELVKRGLLPRKPLYTVEQCADAICALRKGADHA